MSFLVKIFRWTGLYHFLGIKNDRNLEDGFLLTTPPNEEAILKLKQAVN